MCPFTLKELINMAWAIKINAKHYRLNEYEFSKNKRDFKKWNSLKDYQKIAFIVCFHDERSGIQLSRYSNIKGTYYQFEKGNDRYDFKKKMFSYPHVNHENEDFFECLEIFAKPIK